MTIQIQLTSEEESRLTRFAQERGISLQDLAHQLITEGVPLHAEAGQIYQTPEEKIRALDAIAERNRHLPVLPPEAFERENIYADDNEGLR